MSEPVSNPYSNDQEPKGGESPADGVDPAVQWFHERNKRHKRKLLRRLAQGAAFETGKELAKEQDLGQRLVDFIGWLQDNL